MYLTEDLYPEYGRFLQINKATKYQNKYLMNEEAQLWAHSTSLTVRDTRLKPQWRMFSPYQVTKIISTDNTQFWGDQSVLLTP